MVGYDAVIEGAILLLMGYLAWKLRENSRKLDTLATAMAVVEERTVNVKEDHDLLVVNNYRAGVMEKDLNGIGSKLKGIEGRIK